MIILNDFNTSVEKALTEIEPRWKELPGIIVCGTHKPIPEKIDDFLTDIKMARENNIPFLGICFGMQLMAIEYAKNVLNIENATSEEFGTGTLIVKKMPGLRVGMIPAVVNKTLSAESFWHLYRVDIDLILTKDEWDFGEANEVVTWMKLDNHPYFVGVQFHPEYQSSKEKPHPLLTEFINHCEQYEASKS